MGEVYRFVAARAVEGRPYVLMFDESDNFIGRLRSYSEVYSYSDVFEWGYIGRGPAQLAHAMCCEVLGVGIGSNPALHSRFVVELLLDYGFHDTWEIRARDVRRLFRDFRRTEAMGKAAVILA